MNRVYDERFPEISLFEGTVLDCVEFMHDNFDECSQDFEFVWMEELI